MQSLGTLGAKALGTVFAVAAGLPLGKYGPMIHIGSIVAAFLSRGARGIKQVDRLFESFRVFSTHAEKRDLVVSGAAAVGRYACGCYVNSVIGFSRFDCTTPPKLYTQGVTAAFGAPIGGLMLAWEEGSSYWSLKLSWRVFFCAMTTLLFTYLVADSPLLRHSKVINQSFLESYAGSFSTGIRVANRDLLVFVAMGLAGGILGAGFNAAHQVSQLGMGGHGYGIAPT
jgi:H+/Cl- antiporter ClcA